MIVGVPKEIKDNENRVALIPAGVQSLVSRGHTVLVERGAGGGSGLPDEAYARAGAEILPDGSAVYARAELLCKVKEPLPKEYPLLRPGQVLFTYLHLAPAPDLTRALLDREAVGIAYETVEAADGRKPLLEPMSEVAGKMAVHVGAYYLAKPLGGRGVLIGGVPGVPPATVVILGGGTVGYNAAKVAAGMGAWVYLLELNPVRLRRLAELLPANVTTLMSNRLSLEECLRRADILIGAVLIPGGKAPRLITRDMLALMRPGAVIVDVSVDQGGCVETTRPTTHSDPIYEVNGILHYCVANMPGAYARTATFALTNATLPYILQVAGKGWRRAAQENPEVALGLNVVHGAVTHPAVAEALGLEYTPWEKAPPTPR
ncbi:MAG: alanine dehydrogenase [candidate division NC10 bacterium]|nr:alanine dehydrogenase [candidate division NC10 bacterium]